MKPIASRHCRMVLGMLLACIAPFAMAAPGEDPVVLSAKVSYLQLPGAATPTSADILHGSGMPDDARAKMAKYVAKAYSSDVGTVQTEKDVVSVTRTNAGRTTCVQSVGAVAPPTGTTAQDQVVVIRGDLINLCR